MKSTSLKWFVPLVALVALALPIAGCGKGGEGGAKKKLKLAFVSNNAADFWTIARAGCAEAEKELGNVSVDFRIPSSAEAAEQQRILNDLVAAGVDGIAVSPISPENQIDFLNKIAGHTLLICHDSDAPASKRVCYIGTDNTAAGVQAGKLIKEALPAGGKIMVFVGKMDAQNAKERFAGIKKELAGSKVQIIDVRTDDADTVRAQSNAADALVKYPDVACLVGLWSYNGPAILNAVRRAGKTGQVKIVCFDEDDQTLEGVSSGEIYGTVVQQPFEFGKQAIVRMEKYLGGDKSALSGPGGQLIIETLNIKKGEAAGFLAHKHKLLGK